MRVYVVPKIGSGKAPVAPANKAATLQARGLAATLFDTWFVGA